MSASRAMPAVDCGRPVRSVLPRGSMFRAGAWSQLASMPAMRGIAAFSVHEKILVVAGWALGAAIARSRLLQADQVLQ